MERRYLSVPGIVGQLLEAGEDLDEESGAIRIQIVLWGGHGAWLCSKTPDHDMFRAGVGVAGGYSSSWSWGAARAAAPKRGNETRGKGKTSDRRREGQAESTAGSRDALDAVGELDGATMGGQCFCR